MQAKRKIFNDPVYGFVSVPHGLLLDIVNHPYFQRLRRIGQVGLAHYVYPGALHTRFHHALGALHLMQETMEVLRAKGVSIAKEEAEGVCAAILLHDIGHGPYSHALEGALVDVHHETLSLMFMESLNQTFKGRLSLAIDIFTDRYEKPFLHQLVSGQLDMDRMDYLNRDSFFTGVSEGVIGYDRIIKMLDVHEGNLVVEEKGIYSIEKFLIARRLMYWQVYLHKTNVAAEQMLIHLLARARQLALEGVALEAPPALRGFLYRPVAQTADPNLLERFARLDDSDIMSAIKYWADSGDLLLRTLSKGLLDRKLFRLEWHGFPIPEEYVQNIYQKVARQLEVDNPRDFVFMGSESNRAYDESKDPIFILFKDDTVQPLTACSEVPVYTQTVTKHYVCYPKTGKGRLTE